MSVAPAGNVDLQRARHELGNCISMLETIFYTRATVKPLPQGVEKRLERLQIDCVKRLEDLNEVLSAVEIRKNGE